MGAIFKKRVLNSFHELYVSGRIKSYTKNKRGNVQEGANRCVTDNIWVRMAEEGCGNSCLPDTP